MASTPDVEGLPGRRARGLQACLAIGLSLTLLVGVAWLWIPPGAVCPDLIAFWTAAELLAQGQNPYDPGLQTQVQHQLGWSLNENGMGIFPFMPYYYPPWFGLACVPFLPLGYPLARVVWFALSAEFLLVAALLLRDPGDRRSRWFYLAVVLLFAFSPVALQLGQVTPLLLLLVAAARKLILLGRDHAAGAVLACATIKPQLTGVLLIAVLVWSIRSGRLAVVTGFVAALAAFGLAATIAFPGWLPAMLQAPHATPLPSLRFPGLGATWPIVLDSVGLGGGVRWFCYLAVALPALALVLKVALDRSTEIDELISSGLIVAFFVAPYGRHYDFPVLVIPLLILLRSWPDGIALAALLAGFVALPYLHFLAILGDPSRPIAPLALRPEYQFFWIPAGVALAWCLTRPQRSMSCQA